MLRAAISDARRRGRERYRSRASEIRVPRDRVAPVHATGQDASDLIRERIAGEEPVLVARLGGVEFDVVHRYLAVRRDARLATRALSRVLGFERTAWSADSAATLINNAGFFPGDAASLERFAELMLQNARAIDVLGLVGTPREDVARTYLRNSVEVRLRDLEPYYDRDPWTEALTGKKVLVVHPFASSIAAQYARRELLFDDPRILPEFELTVIPAVQSIAGTRTPYPTWFDALEHMCRQMDETEFDVALVGCGAYGLPLAAHAKRLGKKGVLLGGAVQILFGIRGKRWDEHEFISRLYNEHWVRPREDERPSDYRDVEDGCYW